MYTTSPSWSIPGKVNHTKIINTPSPSYYHPDKWINQHTPTWKIGTSQRNKQNNQCILGPGPGQYQLNKFKDAVKLGKFNNQNRIKQQISCNPSPNTYSPNYKFNRPSSPTILISAKQKQSKRDTVPGPGQYNFKYMLKKNQVNVKIGRQQRFVTQKVQGPGPQAYTPIKNNFKKISVGFSRQDKRFTSYNQNQQIKMPGPGQYPTIDFFQNSIKYKKGFTIPNRYKQNLENQVPGPGQYNPFNVYENTGPKISIKGKNKSEKIQNTPGPAEYSLQSTLKSKNYGFSIGKQIRNQVNQSRNIPGPGAYDPIQNFYKTPIYSLSRSRVSQNRSLSPGPGAYNPNKDKIKVRPQSAKIGTAKRYQLQKQKGPGPGSYQAKQRPSTPSNSFTKQKRNQKCLYITPGPGQYNIKSIVGHTQNYIKKN